MSYSEVGSDVKLMMANEYEEFIKALISYEKGVTDDDVLDMVYRKYMEDDSMVLLHEGFDELIAECVKEASGRNNQDIDLEPIKDFVRGRIEYHTNGEMQTTIEPSSHDDRISPEVLLSVVNKCWDEGESIKCALLDEMYEGEWFLESKAISERWLFDQIKDDIYKKGDKTIIAGFEELMDYYGDEREVLDCCGYEGTTIDIPAFLNDYYKINIMFATEEEQNLDMSSIMDMYDGDGSFLKDADEFRKIADNALTYLIYQQGYTLEEALRAYYGEKSGSKFLASAADEINNHTYQMGELTALVTARGDELMGLLQGIASKTGYIKMPESTTVGIFNEWNGSGSTLEMELEKPFVVPCSMVRNFQIEGARKENSGYTVDETYGLIGTCWNAEASVAESSPLETNQIDKDYEAARMYLISKEEK